MGSARLFSAGVIAVSVSLLGCTLSVRPEGGTGDAADLPDAAPLSAPADARVADAAPPDATPVLGPFGTPEPLGVNDPDAVDDDPSMTGDLREIYFNSNRGGNSDIWVATRDSVDQPFGAAALVAPVNSADSETTPRVSYDGLALTFASNRGGGGGGGTDLWISTRASRDDPWSEPVPLTSLNSAGTDAGAGLDATRTRIVFYSNRDGDNQIYQATRPSPDGDFGDPVLVDGVNTANSESSPFLTADALGLYFGSDRDGDSDLYFAERASVLESFGPASQVEGVNGDAGESDAWVSIDQRIILFTSDRSGSEELYRARR